MEIKKIQSVCIYGKPSEGGGNELNQALKDRQECTKRGKNLSLPCGVNSVDDIQGTAGRLPKSKSSEKVEGMTSVTQVVMLGEKFGLHVIVQQIYEH